MITNYHKKYSDLQNDRQKLSELLPLKKPLSIFIEPTNRCNFKCKMCAHGLDNYSLMCGPLMDMSDECFDKIISDLKKWTISDGNIPFKVIRLYLEGEPFLNKNIISFLHKIRENILVDRLEITTNGSILTEEYIDGIIKNQLDYIRISIYSVDSAKNKWITKNNISPDKIKDNIIRLRDKRNQLGADKPFIYVKLIDTFSDENQKFIDMYKDIADEVCIETPMNWTNNSNNNFIKKYLQDDSMVEAANNKIVMESSEKYACPYPFYSLSIKSNGDVLVCCVDYLRDTKIGNVLEQTLEEIWNGKSLYELRRLHLTHKKHLNKSCRHCQIPERQPSEDNIDDICIDLFNQPII